MGGLSLNSTPEGIISAEVVTMPFLEPTPLPWELQATYDGLMYLCITTCFGLKMLPLKMWNTLCYKILGSFSFSLNFGKEMCARQGMPKSQLWGFEKFLSGIGWMVVPACETSFWDPHMHFRSILGRVAPQWKRGWGYKDLLSCYTELTGQRWPSKEGECTDIAFCPRKYGWTLSLPSSHFKDGSGISMCELQIHAHHMTCQWLWDLKKYTKPRHMVRCDFSFICETRLFHKSDFTGSQKW